MQRVKYFGNVRSSPEWMGDYGRERNNIMAIPVKLDLAQFSDANSIKVVVGAAGAAANATTVPIDALSLPGNMATIAIEGNNVLIPAGTTISFGAAGSKKFVRLTADAEIGDTSLATEAIPTALVDNDTGYVRTGDALTPWKAIPSGTLLGRTYAERDANTAMGAADDTDDEFFLLAFDVIGRDEGELYKHGSLVKENYLPDWTTISADAPLLAKLRASYRCIKGVD